jgi:hypothetical protein
MRTAGFITRYVLKRGRHHFVPLRAGTCHDAPGEVTS